MSEATETDGSERNSRQQAFPDLDKMSEEDLLVLVEAAFDRLSHDGIGSAIEAAQQKLRAKAEAEKEEILREVREKVAALGMRIELLPINAPSRGKGRGVGSVAPKYRGPDGSTWTGRGRPPKWLEALEATGRKRDEFLIKQ